MAFELAICQGGAHGDQSFGYSGYRESKIAVALAPGTAPSAISAVLGFR
jgi:hypothetical protein